MFMVVFQNSYYLCGGMKELMLCFSWYYRINVTFVVVLHNLMLCLCCLCSATSEFDAIFLVVFKFWNSIRKIPLILQYNHKHRIKFWKTNTNRALLLIYNHKHNIKFCNTTTNSALILRYQHKDNINSEIQEQTCH